MNLADYLILAVIAQLFWVIRKVTTLNSVQSVLRRKCPLLKNPKEEKEE